MKLDNIKKEIISMIELQSGESRNLDFKASGDFTTYKNKIIKAALAFSNTKNGGSFVIGVSEQEKKSLKLTGMSEADIQSYEKDSIQSEINKVISPLIEIELAKTEINGFKIVIISFNEFTSEPILCQSDIFENPSIKNPKVIIKKGVLYHRGVRVPSTMEVVGKEELQVFLDFFVNKKRNYCLNILNASVNSAVLDEEAYRKERGNL